MSTTPTTNLNLIKNNADEPIANWRSNANTNMNTLDTAIKAVQDATETLEKARQNLNNLIGVLGKNSSNTDLISKAQARANLDVAQSGGAAKTLYADEQTIAQNASLIASLQDSVSCEDCSSHIKFFPGVTANDKILYKAGKLMILTLNGQVSTISTGWNYLATIDNGYRPLITFRGIGCIPFPDAGFRDCAVNPDDGVVRMYSFMSSSTPVEFRMTLSYVIKET